MSQIVKGIGRKVIGKETAAIQLCVIVILYNSVMLNAFFISNRSIYSLDYNSV